MCPWIMIVMLKTMNNRPYATVARVNTSPSTWLEAHPWNKRLAPLFWMSWLPHVVESLKEGPRYGPRWHHTPLLGWVGVTPCYAKAKKEVHDSSCACSISKSLTCVFCFPDTLIYTSRPHVRGQDSLKNNLYFLDYSIELTLINKDWACGPIAFEHVHPTHTPLKKIGVQSRRVIA